MFQRIKIGIQLFTKNLSLFHAKPIQVKGFPLALFRKFVLEKKLFSRKVRIVRKKVLFFVKKN